MSELRLDGLKTELPSKSMIARECQSHTSNRDLRDRYALFVDRIHFKQPCQWPQSA